MAVPVAWSFHPLSAVPFALPTIHYSTYSLPLPLLPHDRGLDQLALQPLKAYTPWALLMSGSTTHFTSFDGRRRCNCSDGDISTIGALVPSWATRPSSISSTALVLTSVSSTALVLTSSAQWRPWSARPSGHRQESLGTTSYSLSSSKFDLYCPCCPRLPRPGLPDTTLNLPLPL